MYFGWRRRRPFLVEAPVQWVDASQSLARCSAEVKLEVCLETSLLSSRWRDMEWQSLSKFVASALGTGRGSGLPIEGSVRV